MGRNSTHTLAIVQAGGKSTAKTEVSRKFYSVLETVSAIGVVIPPFIVWQDKTYRQSYYSAPASEACVKEAKFAFSESGYMDDDLSLQYIKEHFDPYTPDPAFKVENGADSKYGNPPKCMIVDGHSSHITWRVVQYSLENNIHMICLPSKFTYLLQPLDVGCCSVLQTTYEKNCSGWLRENPLSVTSKPAFLDILHKTHSEVYPKECITGACRKSRCSPINRIFTESDPMHEKG